MEKCCTNSGTWLDKRRILIFDETLKGHLVPLFALCLKNLLLLFYLLEDLQKERNISD